MDYDIVIATRNRPAALRLSVPLMLSQSLPTKQLILVDSSDDHGQTCRIAEEAVRGTRTELKVLYEKPGLTRQRNVGLRHVTSEIVMFPDDDALWYPDVAAAIMRIYELDERGDIGAVCAAEALEPPPGVFKDADINHTIKDSDRVRKRISGLRAAIERRLFPDPFLLHGRSRWGVRPTPPWLEEEDAVLVCYMTGFRMSFRTHVIREYGFDETLTEYALNEDVDASFSVMRDFLILGARKAKVYHHRAPGRRSSELKLGLVNLMNRAYVICKHSPVGSLARRRLYRYGWYKLMFYSAGALTPFGRQRFVGAWRAVKCIPRLVETPQEELAGRYLELLNKCLHGEAVSL